MHPGQSKGGEEIFVDNLTINDKRFQPNQEVKFEFSVTNTGSEVLNELTFKDVLPGFVDFVSGPGNFDESTNTLTLNITNLNPGETTKFVMITRVVASNLLPAGQGVVCTVNQASVVFGSEESKDNSQFCIEKEVTTGANIPTTTKGGLPVMDAPPIKETPDTGPGMLSLLGLIPAGLAGFYIRRRASK
jgi:uncharacterized repeat protein (TIGR01451 family)